MADPSNAYPAGVAAPSVGYAPVPYATVPYATGPAYGDITAPAYGRSYAADLVFGYYPVLYPW